MIASLSHTVYEIGNYDLRIMLKIGYCTASIRIWIVYGIG
jgi:hypothetical protein